MGRNYTRVELSVLIEWHHSRNMIKRYECKKKKKKKKVIKDELEEGVLKKLFF